MMDYVLRKTKRRFARVLEIAYELDVLPHGFRTRDAELFLNRIATNIDLATQYVAQPIAGTVHLFTATGATDNLRPVDVETWRRLCGSVEVIPVPGNHISLMKQPHVRTLGPGSARRSTGSPRGRPPRDDQRTGVASGESHDSRRS